MQHSSGCRLLLTHRLLPGTQRNTQQTLPLSKCCLQPPINDGGLPALQHPSLLSKRCLQPPINDVGLPALQHPTLLSKRCLQPPINDGGLPALQHPTLQHQLCTLVCILHMLPPSPHSQGHQPMVALLHTGMDRSVAGSSGMAGACYKGGPAPS